MINFRKYNSLENHYQQKFVDNVSIYHGNCKFVIQEKIHGANFAFYCDGKEVRMAKRSSLINNDSNFYNCKVVYAKYKADILKLFNLLLGAREGKLSQIIVYGELYGGNYPHSEVEKTQHKTVQKGVYYCPQVDFAIFDIFIDSEEEKYYIDALQVPELAKTFDLPFVPILFTGSLDECLTYSNSMESTIYKLHNLPEIENNICEGIVIRPITLSDWLPNGSRAVIKSKNEKFTEVTKVRIKREKKEPITTEQQKYLDLFGGYFNDNRLNNVISKIGEVNHPGKLIGPLSQDALEDFKKDYPEFNNWGKDDQKILKKHANSFAKRIIFKNELYLKTNYI